MWFIFLIACIVVALAALVVIWIGSMVLRSIEKKDRELAKELYEREKEKNS